MIGQTTMAFEPVQGTGYDTLSWISEHGTVHLLYQEPDNMLKPLSPQNLAAFDPQVTPLVVSHLFTLSFYENRFLAGTPIERGESGQGQEFTIALTGREPENIFIKDFSPMSSKVHELAKRIYLQAVNGLQEKLTKEHNNRPVRRSRKCTIL